MVHLDDRNESVLRDHREAVETQAEKRAELAVPQYVFVNDLGNPTIQSN